MPAQQTFLNSLMSGVVIAVVATATWALLAYGWGRLQAAVVARSLRKSISVESDRRWRIDPYICIENQLEVPINILQVEIIIEGNEFYGPRLLPLAIGIRHEDDRRNIHPAVLTLQPKQKADWIYVRRKGDVKACNVYVEFSTPLRDRNYLIYQVKGEAFDILKEQMSWEDDEPHGVKFSD